MDRLTITKETIEALGQFRDERKFVPVFLYPGAPDEVTRVVCEDAINNIIERLSLELPNNPDKEVVVTVFKRHLEQFNNLDTEEREQAAGYCEAIMDILGIENSDGVLNNWLYGFDAHEKP